MTLKPNDFDNLKHRVFSEQIRLHSRVKDYSSLVTEIQEICKRGKNQTAEQVEKEFNRL